MLLVLSCTDLIWAESKVGKAILAYANTVKLSYLLHKLL